MVFYATQFFFVSTPSQPELNSTKYFLVQKIFLEQNSFFQQRFLLNHNCFKPKNSLQPKLFSVLKLFLFEKKVLEPTRIYVYWEGGTPHILARYVNKGGDTAQIQSEVYSACKSIWSVGGWFFKEIIPLRGSILQAETCQILSLAENPR